MPLGLCIVGCGTFAQSFVQGIAPLRDEVDLYFASRDSKRAQEYSTRFSGAGAFGSYEAAAADPRINAMYISTPHHLHLDHVRIAAEAGKHVLVEKPIARSMEEAAQIIETAHKAGVTLMVAENYRFMAPVRECKRLVDNGDLGQLRLMQLQEEASFSPTGWRALIEQNGGGVLIDGGIHKFHFLRYMAGEPATIYAATLPKALSNHEGEDGAIVITRWADGTIGLINHSWARSRQPSPGLVSVSGTGGRLTFEAGNSWLTLEREDFVETITFPPDNAGLTPMVREFLDSIRENREPETSGTEGIKDLALVLNTYKSISQGVPVEGS